MLKGKSPRHGILCGKYDLDQGQIEHVTLLTTYGQVTGLSYTLINYRMFWILVLSLSLFYCGISSYDMYKRLDQGSIAITYDSDESSVETVSSFGTYY
jgi:hypothetical protein